MKVLPLGIHLAFLGHFKFTWEGGLPEGTPAELGLAGEVVDGDFLLGFLCFGCPVGEDRYVIHKLKVLKDNIVSDGGGGSQR